jgi:hypothetical protein
MLPLFAVASIIAVLGGCENAGNRHAVALEKEPGEMRNAEFTCGHSYWCADIKGPISAKHLHVAEEGRFAKVGIGFPKEKSIESALEVKGTILAEEILVQANVADYVFAPGYELKSLAFVEEFIQRHQHLPGISSASDAAANEGRVEIGNSYRLLLEKIEELTLYSIQQEKRIQLLESMITEGQKFE